MVNFFRLKQIRRIFFLSTISICGLIYFNQIPQLIDYSIYLSISTFLFGFLITTLSIILVFPNGGRIKILKEHDSFKNLFNIFLFTIFLEILLFLISLIGNLYNIQSYEFKILFLGIIIISILFVILCLWILKKMIDTLFNKNR